MAPPAQAAAAALGERLCGFQPTWSNPRSRGLEPRTSNRRASSGRGRAAGESGPTFSRISNRKKLQYTLPDGDLPVFSCHNISLQYTTAQYSTVHYSTAVPAFAYGLKRSGYNGWTAARGKKLDSKRCQRGWGWDESIGSLPIYWQTAVRGAHVTPA